MTRTDGLRWLEPWRAITPSEAKAAEGELRREVIPGHALHNVSAQALGRLDGRDAVVFSLADGRFAIAHLTWIGKAEQTVDWPRAEFFPDAESLEERIRADHDEYAI